MSSLIHAWKRLFERPAASAGLQASEIRAWQKTLLEEQEALRDELDGLLRTYVRTVDRFVERASTLTEAQSTREQEAIESIRGILQNAIRRLEVSSKDHRELMDEWHEWVAFRRAAGERHELESAHKLRVEMIRSELTVRGIEVDDGASQKRIAEVQSQEEATDLPAPSAPVYASPRQVHLPVDELADWIILRNAHILPEWKEAERAWKEIAPEAHLYPEHAAATLRRLKDAHADLKTLDRASRETRYRIEVFEQRVDIS